MGIGVEPSGAAAPAVELSPLHPSETLLRQINYKIPRICSLLRYGGDASQDMRTMMHISCYVVR